MATQSVNAVIVDLPGDVIDDGDNSDCFIFSKPLTTRGSTKRDAISVESYDRDRKLQRLLVCSPHTPVKSESPIYIDLDQYDDDDDDDDVRILCFPPPNFTKFEKGQSSASKTTVTFECEICVESKSVIESFWISGCSHFYCSDCVSKYIAAKLQDNLLSIECPVSGCSGRLEPDQCRGILPREVFDRWGDALCEAVVMRSKRIYCPYKDCSALLFLDEGEKNMKEAECPHCHRMVCVECGTTWHPEITCEEFQKMAENERGTDDLLLANMAKKKKWRRCPSCKFYIEKSQGCLYMKCRCGLAFCYNCGTPSRDHSHYCYNCKR
ncbi:PREDICTED: ATP-dependent RNA helicase DEAH12, chloroplastic-like isoform X2 [Camelina sativa]|uniref:RBR-type E3 ubiquitin transferase n=1 Tax=Camelina sativa TaxID=90675 RepID=A0ABM0TIT1_CAMSA|nr:PREDICTED: ATP-dependent RNA helicase DEAH12, chloroplastic-like isoform X1 [Camelina sativa]XP_010427026.1 PREDICTED: ATP-dependent RNA helicase DEAH12, chloroplastic-like isoform X2 [Camelina sativa]